ncbi:1,2-dihydroxy-3-keto-5-methylthiopentene dioxygenase [Mycena sanguinolenta]|uniref:Acireductone dioxygenase n=1 Tax=Mycena sanguinolenta TaxID=230812 RepID=A0A8H7CWX6_9AGAR|nr:1,2-dihydroxy-3-keto-5-methylthiopentene dioxygenase [Mycena sanguinolenta]
MHAYYFDNLPTDQRLPHITDPARPVSPEALTKLGVLSWVVPVDGHEGGVDEADDDFEVNRVAKERGYKNRDVINVSREGMGSVYEEKIRGFFEEHMHEDEEIRYILSGSGFFDVREMPTDAWIRIAVTPGDLLVLPAGIYHRFTLDTKDQIRALRLFKYARTFFGETRRISALAPLLVFHARRLLAFHWVSPLYVALLLPASMLRHRHPYRPYSSLFPRFLPFLLLSSLYRFRCAVRRRRLPYPPASSFPLPSFFMLAPMQMLPHSHHVSLFPLLDEPKWIPHARSAGTDANAHRVGYLRDIGAGIAPAVGA